MERHFFMISRALNARKRKIFALLFAALMSVGMYATTVTWNNNDITGSGKSFTKDGVTITAGNIDFNEKNFMHGGTFTTTLGNFTKIEVTAGDVDVSGTGWSGSWSSKTWAGTPASSVSFSGDIMGMGMGNTQFVFTIEEPAPTTYTLQLVADPTKGSVAVTNLLGSDIIDNGNGNYTVPENAEVTILATPLEGYEFTGWKAGDISCDFLDCGTALNTIENPMTIGLVRDVALMAEFAAAAPAAKYYIVGSMNSWGVDENYEMNPSLEAETEEYFYTLDLTTTSEFKVVKVQNGQQSWIPEGMGNNYGQNGEITEDGEYTVYFRPNYDGGEDWFYSCIYAEKTGEFVPETPTYYLVGNMTEWDVNENYELNPNIDSDIEEYFYVLDLTTTNQFKVVKVQNGQQTWYPSGMDNNYGQNGEITEDGEYTIYFRPNYNGGEGWFYNCLYVSKNEPEPQGEVTVVFAANNKTVERTVTLPHTFKCSWDNGMDGPDELDIIIHELYNDYYYCNSNMNASGSDQVEVGTEEAPKNDYITIKGVFEGTATVTGDYFDWITGEEGAHNYSITISIKGDEPTAIINTAVDTKAVKRIVNGQLLIIRDGKLYNVQGAEIK